MLAEVMQFYGLGWSDLLEMEMVWFSKLYQKIPLVEARRLLGWLDVVMRAGCSHARWVPTGVGRDRRRALARERWSRWARR